MSRKSPKSISINPNVRCVRIYPVESTDKTIKDLKTVGIRLDREQALQLARILLAVTQEWEEIDLTAYRLKKRRSDGTYQVTVTSFRPEE